MIRGLERDTTLISVVGLERMDVIYYVSRLLSCAGYRIMIVDNTRLHELFYSIRKADDQERLAQTNNIYTIKNCAFSEEFFNQFDYVFIAHGFEVEDTLWFNSDIYLLQTDLKACTTYGIKKQMTKEIGKVNLLVFDMYGKKVTMEVLRKEIGVTTEQVEDMYELFYNETDYLHYMQLLRNGGQSIKKLSVDTKNVIYALFDKLNPGVNKKEMAKIVKKA